ncbi:MFS transporter [Vogesella sp. LIG4]|uniref:MFS transporter n=1 Tax=Vogesella sp. LIG4 TaxID=1192162 RepID=UPI00081F83C9|nr:MFS transporter [Vogesella sp. LIG4]SCK16455.1 MFS transporter, ACS family, 4-hydroxyphenylacetate permease [Vogesella sp. LIG4]
MQMEKTEARPVGAASAPHSQQLDQQVINKVSGRLIWFLFILFVFSFLDRINIGFAGLTMSQSLNLSATMFGLATTLFYVAYVACGIPSNMVLSRMGARRWIAIIMVAWGLASTATMFAHDATSLYILRALVGVTEAGFLPGMLLYLTFWFPRAYRARANALFMIAMPVTAAAGSVVSGYLLELDGHWGLAGWQWLFMVEGLPAALLGITVWCYLDDSPAQASWLSSEEKARLQHMLQAEQQPAASVGREVGIWRELLSPSVLKFALAYFCLVNTLSMVNIWVPQIVKSFNSGSSNATIGILAAIPQLATIVAMLWWGARSDRKQERRWHTVLPMLAAAGGWLLCAYADGASMRLAGIVIASAGAFTAMTIFWTTPDAVLSTRAKAIGIALINATGNVGSALSSVVVGWLKDISHSFTSGMLFAVAVLVIGALVMLAIPVGKPAQH